MKKTLIMFYVKQIAYDKNKLCSHCALGFIKSENEQGRKRNANMMCAHFINYFNNFSTVCLIGL